MKRGAEVYVTGCPSIDIADQLPTPWRPYTSGVIVLQHPVTTEVDQAGAQMEVTIKAVRSIRGLPYTFFWPGEDAGASAMNKRLRLASIKPVRNKPPMEFLRLLASADCLVGNSSVGIRECSFLGVPVVNIGTRQQGRERAGNVIDVKHDVDDIATAIRYCISNPRPERSTLYGDGHAGERIAGILAGKVMESAA
jgi:UDP-N-acetylglucosamine 2-epimerase